ncbi:MAG: hypothetical protein J2O48_01025 [Solirubrobacterales bacterium]|nr:hypothetical protein [Solirubrobacterales bacterium]
MAASLLAACFVFLGSSGFASGKTGRRHAGARDVLVLGTPKLLRATNMSRTRQATPASPFSFGIYPGGPAGTVGPAGTTVPEDPAKRLAALRELQAPGQPLLLHVYVGYAGAGTASAADQIGSQISSYTAAGFQVELVLRYQSAGDIAGYVNFVKQTVDQLGGDPGLVSLQVTNEANVGGAPNASDGYYQGAEDALIQGVEAAKAESRATGHTQLRIGFNWAYDTGGGESGFWSYLVRHGGSPFRAALDWVGIDIYPGTWGPPLSTTTADSVRSWTSSALTKLRSTYMQTAGIAASVPIHITEAGYPTGPGRSSATQATVLSGLVGAVSAQRSKLNLATFCWFDLRDADSSSTSFESQYGLMSDSYTPKPAFGDYQQLIAAGT